MQFKIEKRVYYSDTDAGGVVYHSKYLDFCEHCRTEYLRYLGLEQVKLRDEHNLLFVVHHCDITFKSAAQLDDLLEVSIDKVQLKGCILLMEQTISKDGKTLIKNSVELVLVNKDFQLIRHFPPFLLQQMGL